jgi:hypothetical protein
VSRAGRVPRAVSQPGRVPRVGPASDEVHPRPLYARVLRLRHLHPSGMACFALLEGSVGVALLLALAELVSWWALIVLPALVALLVKGNDVVAGVAARAAALVPEEERERFRRNLLPAVGRAGIPVDATARPPGEPS